MLIVAMVMAIPTMLAQETVYVAYGTSGTSTALKAPVTNDGELTYNPDANTYTGKIELYQSSYVNRDLPMKVTFYKGSEDAPSFIGNTSGGAYSPLKFTLDEEKDVYATVPLATSTTGYCWYVTGANFPPGVDNTTALPLNVTIDMSKASPMVTFEYAPEGGNKNPENFYVFSFIDQVWTNIGTLSPTSDGAATYEGTASTTAMNQSFLLCSTENFNSGSAYGQVFTGTTTTDVKLTQPGTSQALTMGQNTTSTWITNAGTYKFEFNYETMALNVSLESLDPLHPAELRVIKGSGSSTNTTWPAPATSDVKLERQANGTYVGSFPVSGRADFFEFYSTTAGETTYWGSGSATGKTLTVTNPETLTNLTLKNADQPKTADGAGFWYVYTYPDSNFCTVGTLTATVDVDNMTVSFTFEPGTPATLYINGAATSGATSATTTVDAEAENNVFTWELEVPAGGLYFLICNAQKSMTSFAYGAPADKTEIDLTSGSYSAVWQGYAAGQWKKGHIATPGTYTVEFDYSTKVVNIYQDEKSEADPTVYVRLQNGENANTIWTISDDDPVMTETDGVWSVTVENVVPRTYVRYYTKDLAGQPQWMGPGSLGQVNLDENNPFVSEVDLEVATLSAWYIRFLVNEAESATVTFSYDPENNVVQFEDSAVAEAPAAMYVWTTEGDADNNDDLGGLKNVYLGALNPSSSNANLFEGTITFSAGAQFFLNQSETSAGYKAWNAAYDNVSGSAGSQSGDAPVVAFTGGKYTVKMYRGTIAPNGGPLTSILFSAGGTVKMSFDWTTQELTVYEPSTEPEGPAYVQIAYQPASMKAIEFNPETDAKLMAVDGQEGVYSGNLTMNLNRAFVFYTEEDDNSRTTYNADYNWPPTMGAVTTVWGEYDYWPNADSENDDDTAANVVVNGKGAWMVTPAPKGTGVYTVTLDLNTNKLSIKVAADEKPAAPETMYLWGTTDGYEIQSRYTAMGQFTKEGNVYTLEMTVPSCGVFEPDGEFSASEGDPNYGFYFLLCNNGESMTANGAKMYQAPLTNHLINLASVGSTYSAELSTDKSGHNMIAVTPGVVKFTFDYDTDIFTAEMVQPYNQVQLNFTGATAAYKHVTAMTMMSEDPETLDLRKQLLLSYETQEGIMFKADDDYNLEITCTNVPGGEGSWQVMPGAMAMADGIQPANSLMLMLGPGAKNAVFNINVIAPPRYANFVFKNGDNMANENAYEVLTAEAQNYNWDTDENGDNDPEAIGDPQELTFSADTYKYEFADMAQVTFTVPEGYTATLEASVNQGVDTYVASWDDEHMIGIYADGITFTITVSKEVQDCTLELSFVGDGITLDDVNNFVTIVDQAELIGSQGEYTGVLNIDSNPFTYTFSTYYPEMAMLELTPAKGYMIKSITYDEASYPDAQVFIQGGETGVWMISASSTYGVPVTITLAKEPNKATFNFTGIPNAYDYVNFISLTEGPVDLTGNQYVLEYEGNQAALFISAKEGYQVSIECTTEGAIEYTEGAQKYDYVITGLNQNDVVQYSVGIYTPGLEFNVVVNQAAAPVPDDAIRFEFTGVEDGWKYVHMEDAMDIDGAVVEITGTPFDFSFKGMTYLVIGCEPEFLGQYEITVSCETSEADARGAYQLQSQPIDYNGTLLKNWMLMANQNAYGMTFIVNVEKLAQPNKVTFVITDGEVGERSAVVNRAIMAVVTPYDEDLEPGEETELYFTDLDVDFEYEYAAMLEFKMNELFKDYQDYKIFSITCDENSGGDTYMIMDDQDGDNWTLALYPGANGYTFTILVKKDVSNGITGIYDFDGADSFTVVNLQGVVLLRNAAADELNRLENGMYIINGKKVVVRK